MPVFQEFPGNKVRCSNRYPRIVRYLNMFSISVVSAISLYTIYLPCLVFTFFLVFVFFFTFCYEKLRGGQLRLTGVLAWVREIEDIKVNPKSNDQSLLVFHYGRFGVNGLVLVYRYWVISLDQTPALQQARILPRSCTLLCTEMYRNRTVNIA